MNKRVILSHEGNFSPGDYNELHQSDFTVMATPKFRWLAKKPVFLAHVTGGRGSTAALLQAGGMVCRCGSCTFLPSLWGSPDLGRIASMVKGRYEGGLTYL